MFLQPHPHSSRIVHQLQPHCHPAGSCRGVQLHAHCKRARVGRCIDGVRPHGQQQRHLHSDGARQAQAYTLLWQHQVCCKAAGLCRAIRLHCEVPAAAVAASTGAVEGKVAAACCCTLQDKLQVSKWYQRLQRTSMHVIRTCSSSRGSMEVASATLFTPCPLATCHCMQTNSTLVNSKLLLQSLSAFNAMCSMTSAGESQLGWISTLLLVHAMGQHHADRHAAPSQL